MPSQPGVSGTVSLQIQKSSVNGPLNLNETLLSGQTSEPEWQRYDSGFIDVEVLSDTPVRYTLSQIGGVDNCTLRIRATATGSYDSVEVTAALEKHLSHVLGLEDDLGFFYRKFIQEDVVLARTFENFKGLRLMRGTSLYESLISSILSQNNSVRLWNRSVRLMMRYYGQALDFPDGPQQFLFPEATTLAELKPRELNSRTSIGYRAKPVVAVSRMVVNGEVNLSELRDLSYESAKERLLELPGVGPKVADCFLLYGLGRGEAAPVDVWIHRIVSSLYFRRKKVSRLKTAEFLRDRFGRWAGYAQLYLFDYARKISR